MPLAKPLKMKRKEYSFVYEAHNENLVNDLLASFDKAKGRLGIDFQGSTDDINYVHIPNEDDLRRDDGLSKKDMAFGGKFIHCIRNTLFPGDKNEGNRVKIAFVLVSRENDKKAIKSYLDRCGCVSQFLLLNTMKKKVSSLAVMGNILKQVNAKAGYDNWRLDLPKSITDKHTMFVGLDVC